MLTPIITLALSRNCPVPEQEEFRLADEACSALLAAAGRADWAALLQPFPFFTAFKNYLQASSAQMKMIF